MSERGVFAVDRGVFDHPLFNENRQFSRMEAWVWLLSEAAWKPTKRQVSGKIITIDRGQLSHSVRFMADAWGWSKSAVDRFLTRLKTETMIGTDSGTGVLVVTICKYNEYQKVSLPKRDKNEPASGTAAGQQRDRLENTETNEVISSLRSDIELAAPKPKNGTRLDENWVLPKSFGDWALAQGLPRERILVEATKMRNWSINAGAKGVKKDWMAAWQNWVQGAIDTLPRGSPAQQRGKPRNIAEASTQLLAQMRAANADTEPRTSHSLPEQTVPSLAPPVRQFRSE